MRVGLLRRQSGGERERNGDERGTTHGFPESDRPGIVPSPNIQTLLCGFGLRPRAEDQASRARGGGNRGIGAAVDVRVDVSLKEGEVCVLQTRFRELNDEVSGGPDWHLASNQVRERRAAW